MTNWIVALVIFVVAGLAGAVTYNAFFSSNSAVDVQETAAPAAEEVTE